MRMCKCVYVCGIEPKVTLANPPLGAVATAIGSYEVGSK